MTELPARIQSEMPTKEAALAFVWARVPRPRTGYLTLLGIGPFIQLVDLIRGRRQRKVVREGSREINFPLDRNMAMAVTSQRVLIWRASRHARTRPVLLGEVTRDRIAAAKLPFVNDGWQWVEVRLVGGGGVRFLVDGKGAEDFVRALQP